MVSKNSIYNISNILCYWSWPYTYLLRHTFIPEAYVSHHAGTCIEINHDLYRSLQIFFMLAKVNPNFNRRTEFVVLVYICDKFYWQIRVSRTVLSRSSIACQYNKVIIFHACVLYTLHDIIIIQPVNNWLTCALMTFHNLFSIYAIESIRIS